MMILYVLCTLIHSFVFVLTADAAATRRPVRSCVVAKNAMAIGSEEHCAYVKQRLEKLYGSRKYDRAYTLALKAVRKFPERFGSYPQLILGKLSLVQTPLGMPRNEHFAVYWFDKVETSKYATLEEKKEAAACLDALPGYVPPLGVCDELKTNESRQLLDGETVNHCLTCAKSFSTSKGLRIHQSRVQHK